MNITALGHTSAPFITRPTSEPPATSQPPANSDQVSGSARPEQAQGPKPVSAGNANPPGVLRLLQEGHFQGVADVRLRINFHEALTQQQTQTVQAAAPDAVGALAEQVTNGAGPIADAAGLDEEQTAQLGDAVDAFKDAVKNASDAFTSADAPAVGGLVADLQTSFDSLYQQLQGLVGAEASAAPAAPPAQGDEEAAESAASDTPAEEAAEASGSAAQTAPDVQTMLDQLATEFASSLADLQSSLTDTGSLPPLSEPNGNGQAYAKFLEIYQALQGQSVANAPAAAPVDIQA